MPTKKTQSNPITNDNDTLKFLSLIAKEITGQKLDPDKNVIDATKEVINYLKNIIDNMPGNVYWINCDGITLGCNNNIIKLHGLTQRDEYLGRNYAEFFEAEEFKSIKQTDDKVMNSGKGIILEEKAIKGGKHIATYLSHKIPIRNEQKKVVGLLGISMDITDRKLLEEKLQEAKVQEKLQEEHIKAMKILSAAIAHELRTPLRTISNNTNVKKYIPPLIEGYEIAKKTDSSLIDLSAEQLTSIQEALSDISHEVNYANNFIDMLLVSFQELEAGTTGNTVCSINDCISSALERYPFSTSAERELVHWKPTEDFELLGRPLSVIHILFNLIKNALYFIAKAGKGDIKIWLEKNTKYNKIHFKDTGYGIASNILPGIFDQFSTTTTDGTGIGLTFCKVAMQNMHGSITCNSKEGEYTEFVLRFPKHKK